MKVDWKRVSSDAESGNMLSTMTTEPPNSVSLKPDAKAVSQEPL